MKKRPLSKCTQTGLECFVTQIEMCEMYFCFTSMPPKLSTSKFSTEPIPVWIISRLSNGAWILLNSVKR